MRGLIAAGSLQTGQTPAKAVENLRLEGARALMEHTNYTLDVVAQLTGFGDSNRMRRAFLRAYDQPPQVIRRQSRGYAPIRESRLAEAETDGTQEVNGNLLLPNARAHVA